MTEHEAIEQLKQYRQMRARLDVLSSYSVGAGITVSRLDQEDQLQELHRRLRGLPSYMYLSKHEQELETAAHAYLERYPVGTKAQLAAVPREGYDDEDTKLLQELRGKIRKVIAARGYDVRDDIDAVIERLAEYQDIRDQIKRMDDVLAAVEQVRMEWAQLLRLRYVDGLDAANTARRMNIADRTFRAWRIKAEQEYIKLAK